MDYESAVDAIAAELRKADKSLWTCARIAHDAGVGEWEDDVANDLAAHVGRSAVTIRLWVRALKMFDEMMKFKRQSCIVWEIELYIGHFAKMRTLQAKYNLSPEQVAENFDALIQYKRNGESWSIEALEREVEASAADDRIQPTWNGYHHRRAVDYVVTLLSLPDLPRSWRKWANQAPEKQTFERRVK